MTPTHPTLYGARHAVSAGHYLATAAGFAIPFVSRFLCKKKTPEAVIAPPKPTSWKSYIIPAFKFGLKFLLK